MHASDFHLNRTAEPEPEGLTQDQAEGAKGNPGPDVDHASEGQSTPVHSTSAFKPDPFW
jgi:hypothetical protein